ncbi:Golgi apparatus membrane protein tvp18 [Rhizophlyctis rosea]|nr:Golgi apparatus membrane protein tvp18 [Rhizophlyctis rosea]
MGLGAEVTSGQFTIYAQWFSILSIIFLILFGILNFLSVIIFAIIAFVEAGIMLFLEIPWLTKCCPTSPKFDTFIKTMENTLFRTILYAVFAIIIWLSILMHATSLLVAAITLSITTICYIIAFFKKEDFKRSGITGGAGLAAQGARAYV